jgi:outer membrane immunogenic protein
MKMILTLTILFALCVLGFAGPEPLPSGKEMKEVTPLPPACPTWTGFYIGGFGGYKFAATDIDLNLTGDWEVFNPALGNPGDKNFIEPRAPHDLDASGAELGGLIGYNYQWNKWVLGLEASAGYLWLRDSDNREFLSPRPPGSGDTFPLHTSFKTHYLATVGPRIGYAFCKWLPYVTGGVAVGDIDFDQLLIEEFQAGGRAFQGGSTSETKVGWMVGGGLQHSITDRWSVRAQYQYVNLGCVDFDSIFINDNGRRQPSFSATHEACLREHNASFAIVYGF